MDTPFETVMYHLTNTPLLASFGYLGGVWALHSMMSGREPMAIPKPVMIVYNFAQVFINAYVAYAIAAPLGMRVWGIGMKDSPDVRYGVFLHYLCKYLDFTDTAIIVARKKEEQLSFLHVWHHASIVAVWGWVVNTWPTAEEGGSAAYAYGAWINSIIHVIMYAYYGLTAMGIKPPFKKAVTTCQLTQFASCIVHAISALVLDTTPIFYNAIQVLYHIGMLKLFLPLLLRGKQDGGAKPVCPPFGGKGVDATPSQKAALNKKAK
eukprot:CAMPEP_0115858006 /NCGR_PEP_ID=MMETSP0287-20121206/15872_1 /TAXON_ID=412157 /ORGANISM="Chrysochromulina rotalis, Strain UIO044" /LENGTH=263 /DNA_ID=CAMNT_0003312251 /DNA_START=71 /DNA_END=862 /DNA_ORIENTATION=-